jgi:hypothetical protein
MYHFNQYFMYVLFNSVEYNLLILGVCFYWINSGIPTYTVSGKSME